MNRSRMKVAAHIALAVVLLTLPPSRLLAGGARLEGYVVDVDGRGASGFRVHLIDAEGADVAQAGSSSEGIYRFRELPPGAYSLGIESPEGRMAPVVAPPVELAADELARRDIKLLEADPAAREAVGRENFSFGMWWAGLSPATKAWSIIGTVVILGLTITALDDEDSSSPN
jgi:hypothetical protein